MGNNKQIKQLFDDYKSISVKQWPDEIKSNLGVMLMALEYFNGFAPDSLNIFRNIPKELRNQREFVLRAVVYMPSLIYFDKKYRSDREVVKQSLKSTTGNMELADESLKNDKTFILECLAEGRSVDIVRFVPIHI